MRFVIRADDATPELAIGAKARGLLALAGQACRIPPWIVLTSDACFACQSRQVPQPADRTRSPDTPAPATLESLHDTPAVLAELTAALAELCPAGEPVAVRSSADDEDGTRASFAGQLDSFLGVPPAEVPERVVQVWNSAFAERALAYRQARGLSSPRPPAVLIQRMVDAEVSGVAFGVDPVNGQQTVVVAAVYGLGTSLVSGECDADSFHVDRAGRIIRREIATKHICHRLAPNGVETMPVPHESSAQPALTDEQITAVAELTRAAGSHFRQPQDIEWALQGGELYLLQSRPITTLDRPTGRPGPVIVWDNSNISESYGGVTTPLTFSFARRAYEEVYREFCRLLRVPEERLAAHDDVFRRMLGMLQGRIYYNLLSWYRVLALLPGFRSNRHFMEQMMGVRESLPDELVEELASSRRIERLRDRFHLLHSVAALVHGHCFIRRRIQAFMDRLEDALALVPPDLSKLRADELAALYRELERRLIKRWDAPLLNDFLAMIFHGVLGKLTRAWCDDADGDLRNDLLRGDGGMISAEPAAWVRRLAVRVAAVDGLAEVLCDGSREEIERAFETAPEVRAGYLDYLTRFSDRCPGELKLESLSLDQDPRPLWHAMGELARRLGQGESRPAPPSDDENRRRRNEQRIRTSLGPRPWRRFVFRFVLKHARARIRDRENLRFARTRLFGKARRIFAELGQRLHSRGLLEQPRDIFYLDLDEAWGILDATTASANLKALARIRQAEFEEHLHRTPLPSRFETAGDVALPEIRFPAAAVADGQRRQGVGCCPGVVQGPVRVVSDPRADSLRAGEILVAERTDPGWILLLPSAAGLLVERGSLLSHSAVVTRELGIPSVVSVPGLTSWLRDGDWVEFDGKSGLVTRIAAPEGTADLPAREFSHEL